MLVVEHDEVFAGLLVDEVFGLQHFARDSLQPTDTSNSPISPFITGRFQREQTWRVFSLLALARSQGFMNIAL
ncbi:CheW-like domain protein [compost metagenome]